jgi:hypothetical protein
MLRFGGLVWFIIFLFVPGLRADSPLDFSCRDNDQFSFSVFGAPLAYRFEIKLIKPKWQWQGNYDDLIRITASRRLGDRAQISALIGNYGQYHVDVEKKSPTKITATYQLDLFRQLPLKIAYISILIPADFAQQEGRYSPSPKVSIPFPIPLKKQPLFNMFLSSFTWNDGLGRNLKISFSRQTKVDMVDNRQWGRFNFELLVYLPKIESPGKNDFSITLEVPETQPTLRPFVDRFGQCAIKSWPGKVISEKDLQDDARRENPSTPKTFPAGQDAYGGWDGTKQKFNLPATGFFYTRKINNRWWFVNPKGNLFFSLGSFFLHGDSFTDPNTREYLFEWLPPKQGPWKKTWMKYQDIDCVSFYRANLMKKFGPQWGKLWYENTRNRWLDWGFNTTSAFGGRLRHIPFANGPYGLVDQCAPLLPGAAADIFDPELPGKLDTLCRKICTKLKDEPLFIGYFFGNEQPFHKIPLVIPGLSEKFAAKRKLVEFLQNRYQKIENFNRAWALSVKNFPDLAGIKLSAKTPAAGRDMDDFFALYCDTYGRILRETIKKYDPNHLLLGFRWTTITAKNDTLVRHLGKYMDVISINYYTDEGLNEGYLNAISRLAGDKPILLSEFSFGTTDRGYTMAVVNVPNQKLRGLYYQNYVQTAATLNTVVGCHWFEYVDQALTGKYLGGQQGERCNYGLVDITDRPYTDFLEYVIKTNSEIYDLMAGKIKPLKYSDIPKP